MGPIGWPETVFIVLLALLLFGPKKLPELGRLVGKALTEFRRASAELKSTFDREMRNLERETEGLKESANAHFQDSYNYDYSTHDTMHNTSIEAGVDTTSSNELPYSHQLADGAGTGAPYDTTESASAAPGADSTFAAERPAPVITPAPGIIANGSLHEETPFPVAPAEVAGGGHEAARQESATS
jgi:TatA/E family protein of Tat protein translocase